MKLFNIILLVVVLLISFSCEKKDGPDSVLKKFVHYRFGANQSRDTMLDMTTGILSMKIADMTEQEFSSFSNMGGYKLSRFDIHIRKCTEDQCYLTYVVKYSISKLNEVSFKVEVKKIADMKLENGVWKIADVSNIKSFYDSKKPIFP
jgi:hypothetical protein